MLDVAAQSSWVTDAASSSGESIAETIQLEVLSGADSGGQDAGLRRSSRVGVKRPPRYRDEPL